MVHMKLCKFRKAGWGTWRRGLIGVLYQKGECESVCKDWSVHTARHILHTIVMAWALAAFCDPLAALAAFCALRSRLLADFAPLLRREDGKRKWKRGKMVMAAWSESQGSRDGQSVVAAVGRAKLGECIPSSHVGSLSQLVRFERLKAVRRGGQRLLATAVLNS